MSVSVACSNCDRRYAVDASALGKRVKCKWCGTAFVAERVTAGAAPTPATPPRVPSRPPPPPPPSEPADPFAGGGNPFDDPYAAMSALEPSAAPPPPPQRAAASPPPIGRPPMGVPAPAAGGVRPNAAAMDGITPLLAFVYVIAVLGSAIYVHSTWPDSFPPKQVSALRTALWTHAVMKLLAYAAVVSPLVLLAMFAASRIMRFEMPAAAYVKAAGVAALPELLLLTIGLFAPDNTALKIVLVIAILPAAWFVMKFVNDLTVPESLVAFGLTAVLYVGAWFGASLLITTVVVSGMWEASRLGKEEERAKLDAFDRAFADEIKAEMTIVARKLPWSLRYEDPKERREKELAAAAAAAKERAALPPPPPQPTPQPQAATPVRPPAEPPRPDPNSDVYATSNRIESHFNFLGQSEAESSGPEWMQDRLKETEAAITAAERKHPGRSEWTRLRGKFNERKRAIDALPPKDPPADLFQPPPAAASFVPPAVGLTATRPASDEVSVGPFRLRPPAGGKVVVDPALVEAGAVHYVFPSLGGKLELKLAPRQEPRQQRPIVKKYRYQSTDNDRLFAVDAVDSKTVTNGTLGGVPFVRVDSSNNVETKAVYAGAVDNFWFTATLTAPKRGAGEFAAMESAVRSLRQAKPGEPPSDPLAPDRVADQFPQDAKRVGELFKLQPAAAEPHVVGFLTHKDSFVRRDAAALLPEVATARSVPKLLPLVESTDADVAAAARSALKKLAPDQFSDVSELVLNLKSKEYFKRKEAMEKLAITPPATPAQRAEVSEILEGMLLDNDRSHGEEGPAAAALTMWAGDKTSAKIAPLLNDPKLRPSTRRDNLIKAMSGCRDKLAATTVIKWVAIAPEPVREALTRMGPAAEDDAIRVFNEQFTIKKPEAAAVRATLVAVLAEVGTNKSLGALTRAAGDSRDPVAQANAKLAVEQVRARLAAKPTTGPATKPR